LAQGRGNCHQNRDRVDIPVREHHLLLSDFALPAPYNVEYEKTGESITVSLGRDKTKKFVLECSRPDQDHLLMQGRLADDSLTIRLKRIDPSRFLLLNRGFNWMQGFGLYR
jgi:hypothetical protein